MSTAPALNPPLAGEVIDVAGTCAYVKPASARHQASLWNTVLRDDPVFGPASGFVVGVGPRMDGRYPLVWMPMTR